MHAAGDLDGKLVTSSAANCRTDSNTACPLVSLQLQVPAVIPLGSRVLCKEIFVVTFQLYRHQSVVFIELEDTFIVSSVEEF
jgi:hypothetical protein